MAISGLCGLISLLLGTALVCVCQVISPDSSSSVQGVDRVILGSIKCDAAGDLFYQGVEPPSTKTPLKEITADGKQLKKLEIPGEVTQGDLVTATLKVFAVSPRGSIYQLIQTQANEKAPTEKAAIVEFDSDGKYSRTTVLDREFSPSQLAVFSTGDFLVSGITFLQRGANPAYNSFTALFDRSGRFIKEVDTGERSATAGEPANNQTSLSSIQLGIAESGTDYVYLLHEGAKPKVLLISPAGTVERRIELEPPAGASVNALKVGPGEILVEYVKPQTDKNSNAVQYFYLYGSEDGQLLSTSTASPDLHGIFACTDWRGGFSFLAFPNDRGSVLVHAMSR